MLVAKWTVNPAKILRLKNKGSLKKGMDGDVTIFNPDVEITMDSSKFQSKSRNHPFDGWKLKGAPKSAVVRGTIAWKAEDIQVKP
jgi:dihydroorotase